MNANDLAGTANHNAVLSLDDARKVARFFHAMSDPTRVRMLTALAHGQWCVSDLSAALAMDQPAISHQLQYLREMKLVQWEKRGKHVYYTLGEAHLRDILFSSIAHLDCG